MDREIGPACDCELQSTIFAFHQNIKGIVAKVAEYCVLIFSSPRFLFCLWQWIHQIRIDTLWLLIQKYVADVSQKHTKQNKNIARGTTDPGYCHFNYLLSFQLKISIGSNFDHQVVQFALVAKLSKRWRHLHKFQIWPPDALVANLATRWRHLHKFQIWPPDGATCIGCKFGHQMAPLALVTNWTTRLSHLH